MISLVKGHRYQLNSLEGTKDEVVQFIHKEPESEGSTVYKTVSDGTTNEEVLLMLIDRINYLQNEHQGGKFKCKENACAITHIEEALHWLESRTKKRVARGVEGKHVV